jgi:hypothetical protein
MEREEYYKTVQSYIDKIKDLKSWLSETEDDETKTYLQLEIDKQLTEMKKIVNEWGRNLI